MNRWIATAVLFGGLTAAGSYAGPTADGNPAVDIPKTEVSHASVVSRPVHKAFTFQSVNGVTLEDTRRGVVDKLGIPADITKDPFLTGVETYEYGYMSVDLDQGTVSRLTIPAEAGTVAIDGVEVAINPESIRQALGNPDYTAEDGLVYQRGRC
ncbi:hypothetical protein N6H14_04085 [Paenibacillus sp. CC-CFT747]|nr:hypothetical protein N6H14_04085 [Paenibacillus sp. CC-CFT747]